VASCKGMVSEDMNYKGGTSKVGCDVLKRGGSKKFQAAEHDVITPRVFTLTDSSRLIVSTLWRAQTNNTLF
jgi:hypothetical protein